MTDYIGITEAQTNPFAPLTSELVKQLRDNPLAIAEGAAGAPRVEGAALKRKLLGSVETTVDTTSIELLDLDTYVAVRVQADRLTRRGEDSASASVQVSNNNGGSWLTLTTRGLPDADIESPFRVRGNIFVEANPFQSFYYGVSFTLSSGGNLQYDARLFSGLSGINAVRIAVTSGSGIMRAGARLSVWGVVREEET